jgi:hypothetical protein
MSPPDLAQALRRTLEVDTAQVEHRAGGVGQPSAGAPHSVRAGLFMPRLRAEMIRPDGRGVLREARRFDRIEISTPQRSWVGRGKSPRWRYFDPPFRSSPVAIGDLYGYLAFVGWLAPQPEAVTIEADPTDDAFPARRRAGLRASDHLVSRSPRHVDRRYEVARLSSPYPTPQSRVGGDPPILVASGYAPSRLTRALLTGSGVRYSKLVMS